MKNVFSLVAVLLFAAVAAAQPPKAPPVTVDDRLTDLEERVKALEAAYLKKAPAVETAKPAAKPVEATAASPFGPDYTWKHLDGVGYSWVHKSVTQTQAVAPTQAVTASEPVYTYPQSAFQPYTFGQRLPTLSATCGPNGCGVTVTPARRR